MGLLNVYGQLDPLAFCTVNSILTPLGKQRTGLPVDKSSKAETGTASEWRESIVGYTVFPHVLQGLECLFLRKTMQKQGAGPHYAVLMEFPCWA